MSETFGDPGQPAVTELVLGEFLTERALGRVLLLRRKGVLDGREPDVQKIVRDAAARGARFVILDAMDVPYVDTGGIRWLLRLRDALEASGRRLRLAARPTGRVWRILKLMDLGLDVMETVGQAWSKHGKRRPSLMA